MQIKISPADGKVGPPGNRPEIIFVLHLSFFGCVPSNQIQHLFLQLLHRETIIPQAKSCTTTNIKVTQLISKGKENSYLLPLLSMNWIKGSELKRSDLKQISILIEYNISFSNNIFPLQFKKTQLYKCKVLNMSGKVL